VPEAAGLVERCLYFKQMYGNEPVSVEEVIDFVLDDDGAMFHCYVPQGFVQHGKCHWCEQLKKV
jgi:hypothetical protein